MTMVVTNEESTLAVWAAGGAATCWLVFVVSMYIGTKEISYASSMILALCFVMLTVANEAFATRKVCAKLATSFAMIYCTMACIVYYTNLTFVRLAEAPSPEALSIVQFDPPRSAFFAIDQLGYFFMSLSIICIAWTLPPSKFRWWLGFLGVWGATCIALPLMPSQYQSSHDGDNAMFGILLLTVYGLPFVPTYAGLAYHYSRAGCASRATLESMTDERSPLLASQKQ